MSDEMAKVLEQGLRAAGLPEEKIEATLAAHRFTMARFAASAAKVRDPKLRREILAFTGAADPEPDTDPKPDMEPDTDSHPEAKH
jgi:hypothetical protein